MEEIISRKSYTNSRIRELKERLEGGKNLVLDCACVYATGSFGRLEASSSSDLDLFIVGQSKDDNKDENGFKKSKLSRLDEILLKAELISAVRSLGFPDFDGDGKYLVHYSDDMLTKTLGTPYDDASNTLTGRLLLFLESQPLLGENVYHEIIGGVIASYWEDYDAHSENFVPAFLANDILRLWRTFCVNYEANTRPITDEEKKLKRKVKNYKLKHSRMLTCYSALIYLLAVYARSNTVSIDDAKKMTQLTPIDRINWVSEEGFIDPSNVAFGALITQYEKFLKNTRGGDESLKEIFRNKSEGDKLMNDSYEFGDAMFNVMEKVGRGSRLYRLMVI